MRNGIVAFFLLVLVVPALFIYYATRERRPNRFLLPNRYVGRVKVEYGIQGAPPLPVEQNHYLYVIPPNGHLQTSTPSEEGWGEPDEFFYVDGHKRIRLREESDPYPIGTTPPPPMIWGGALGGAEGGPTTLWYFIGTRKQFDHYAEDYPKKHHGATWIE